MNINEQATGKLNGNAIKQSILEQSEQRASAFEQEASEADIGATKEKLESTRGETLGEKLIAEGQKEIQASHKLWSKSKRAGVFKKKFRSISNEAKVRGMEKVSRGKFLIKTSGSSKDASRTLKSKANELKDQAKAARSNGTQNLPKTSVSDSKKQDQKTNDRKDSQNKLGIS